MHAAGELCFGQSVSRLDRSLAGWRWALLFLIERPLLTADGAGPLRIKLAQISLKLVDRGAGIAGELTHAGCLEHHLITKVPPDFHPQHAQIQLMGLWIIRR